MWLRWPHVVIEPMHDDEAPTDAALVHKLVATQFPEWASLPIERVSSSGTDNALFRLGDQFVARLPRIESATKQAEKEHRWLPLLAPLLPLLIPFPVATGRPGEGYPWPWSVYRWLPGEAATGGSLTDPINSAHALAEFVVALQHIDPDGGPRPGEHNFFRGEPLATRDAEVRAAIDALDGVIDRAGATRAWQAALDARAWDRAPVWIHGDLHGGNLLVDQGRVTAVIDFGGLAVADPACDLMVAWTYLPASSREVFRAGVSCDDDAWLRGRGWALSMALIALPYYTTTNPTFAAEARRWLHEVLIDQ